MPKIVKEDFMFRVIANNYKSYVFTSASQAGRHILRKYGKAAFEAAYFEYTGTERA